MHIYDTNVSIMEIKELQYFLAVAEIESVNKAATNIAISAGSLSKAIAKLEDELGQKLFERVGRGIKITPAGITLQAKASQIINLEESARMEIGGNQNHIQVTICGEELLLSKYGIEFGKKVSNLYPDASFKYTAANQSKSVIQKVQNGEAHIGFTTTIGPKNLYSKKIAQIKFATCIGKKHPLHKLSKKSIDVKKLLDYPFVIPDSQILGKTKEKQSIDGWRDDKFKRIIKYHASSIKILESILLTGQAIAYLPEYLIQDSDLTVLDIHGCPYFCEQSIYIICREPQELGWLNQVWL
jgi:DNA-binding transcriptional LysR family regulator